MNKSEVVLVLTTGYEGSQASGASKTGTTAATADGDDVGIDLPAVDF